MVDTDLAELRKKCIKSLYLCTDNVSKYLDTEKDETFAKLKDIVHDYCLLEAAEDSAIRALDMVKRDTNASNLATLDERFVAASQVPHRSNSKHPYLLEFNKRITKKREQNLNNSDVAITATQDKYVDPMTKQIIRDPVRNILCSHVYEKETILRHIQQPKQTKCPVWGCVNREPLQQEHLIEDQDLRLQLAGGSDPHCEMNMDSMSVE